MREPDLFISNGPHEKPLVDTLNQLFLDAAEDRAADIHFEPTQSGETRVRFRTPAGLAEVARFNAEFGRVFDEKIRARAHLSISEKHKPLSGRLRLHFKESERLLDVRVEISPVISGTKVVCRILDQANASRRLCDIEMSEMVRDSIGQLIEEPHGLFIVTGPTGSGKTTTLYAIINELNDEGRNITTIEHPVEYVVDGLNQINVHEIHNPFPQALRSVVRQDPDVILVGEIRDAETAKIAVDAALTGHLVLTTTHANNAAMVATRLIELGVDPATLASAFRGVVSQRLVRRISPDVEMGWGTPNDVQRSWLNFHGIVMGDPKFPVVEDHPSSYQGWLPVMEMIVGDGAVRKAIASGPDAIYEAASRQSQFETLAHAGARHAAAGVTTLEEIRRVTSITDAVRLQSRRLGQVLVEMGYVSVHDIHEVVAKQTRLRREGVVRPLGTLLLEQNLCTPQELVQGLGYSSEAEPIARRMALSGTLSDADLVVALEAWKEARGSLFDYLVNNEFCSWKDLHEASNVSG